MTSFSGASMTKHNNITSCSDVEVPKSNLKTIAICHNLISQSQRMYTAMPLDLAIQVHHDFGSKNLIDLLHSLGHCVSYDEVRRFLTSVAIDEANGTGDVYIPKRLQNLRSINDINRGVYWHNFDQNEATLDGKSTTHAKAAVLFHRGDTQPDDQSIPRLQKKALSASHSIYPEFDDLQRYITHIH